MAIEPAAEPELDPECDPRLKFDKFAENAALPLSARAATTAAAAIGAEVVRADSTTKSIKQNEWAAKVPVLDSAVCDCEW